MKARRTTPGRIPALLALYSLFATSHGYAERVFFEDFEGIGEALAVTTGNTSFATVNLNGSGADIVARDPNDVGNTSGDHFAGSEYADLADLSATGSVFLQANIPDATLFSVRFEYHEPSDASAGTDLVIRTDDSGTGSPSVDLRLNDGDVKDHNGIIGGGAQYSVDTTYYIDIVINSNAAGSENYTDPLGATQSIDAQTYDVWLTAFDFSSSVLIDNIAFRNAETSINRFFIQTFNSQDNQLVFFNNVEVFDPPATITDEPGIATEPKSQTVPDGTGLIELLVEATGPQPFTYQWKLDNVDVPGATSPTLLIDSADSGDAGDYTVVVTNANGSTTSSAATVTLGSTDCTVIDKFDSYATGLLEDVDGGAWTVELPGFSNVVDGGGGDHYLAPLDDDGSGTTPLYTSLSDKAAAIPNGDTGTFFSRIYWDGTTPTDGTIWYGVGDLGGGFNEFKAYIEIQSDGGVSIRDGGSSISTTTTLTTDTWYNLWIVVDNDTDTYRVFMKSTDAAATLADMLVTGSGSSKFAFRSGTSNAIEWAQIIARSTVGPYRVDEIFICDFADLALPPIGVVTPLGPLTIEINGSGDAVLTWPGSGILQQNSALSGSWTDVNGGSATSPHTIPGPISGSDFFRLRD